MLYQLCNNAFAQKVKGGLTIKIHTKFGWILRDVTEEKVGDFGKKGKISVSETKVNQFFQIT